MSSGNKEHITIIRYKADMRELNAELDKTQRKMNKLAAAAKVVAGGYDGSALGGSGPGAKFAGGHPRSHRNH